MRVVQCGFNPGPIDPSELLIAHGPTLAVNIGFDASWNATSLEAPMPGITGAAALVDTGATESCIDSQLAIALQLPIIDQRVIGGVSGAREVNMHLAQIHVPTLPHTVYGAFAGVDLAAGGQRHVALIGRTFLRPFVLNYDGTTGQVLIYEPQAPAAS